MDYIKYINTPKDTAKAAPLISKLQLTVGRLSGGFLYFPYGPAGTLHFLAKVKDQQILPFNAGESICGDDVVINFPLGIDLKEPPWQIEVVTWNDSSSYDHALTVGFFLDPLPREL